MIFGQMFVTAVSMMAGLSNGRYAAHAITPPSFGAMSSMARSRISIPWLVLEVTMTLARK